MSDYRDQSDIKLTLKMVLGQGETAGAVPAMGRSGCSAEDSRGCRNGMGGN